MTALRLLLSCLLLFAAPTYADCTQPTMARGVPVTVPVGEYRWDTTRGVWALARTIRVRPTFPQASELEVPISGPRKMSAAPRDADGEHAGTDASCEPTLPPRIVLGVTYRPVSGAMVLHSFTPTGTDGGLAASPRRPDEEVLPSSGTAPSNFRGCDSPPANRTDQAVLEILNPMLSLGRQFSIGTVLWVSYGRRGNSRHFERVRIDSLEPLEVSLIGPCVKR